MTVEAALVELLTAEAGEPYCAGCLALRIGASLEETRAALLTVQRHVQFRAVTGACSGCARRLSLTGLARRAPQPSAEPRSV